MDRLEKALEKSRQQRAALDPQLAQRQNAVEIGGKTPAFVQSPFDASLVDEDQMERSRIFAHRTRCAEADVYRQLRTKVLQIMAASGAKTLAITSPDYGDGKTTVTLNLGISIALDLKQTVLLVDLDLRKPNMHEYLGVKPHAGLTDYLLNDTPLSDCFMRPPFERVNVLPAGSALDYSSELLGSPKMISLAHELKSRYPDRLVIYDMPPVLNQDDPIAFLPQIDAVLVVVRDGVTRTEDLKRCLQTLSGAKVIGTVLNNCF
jgi:capsular exopolysaccharide synthesis family protein